jgi:hypothetical protein
MLISLKDEILNTKAEYPRGKIATVIERIAACNLAITITSTYKGLILTQPIRVLDILPDRVIFQTPEHRLCFTLKEKVHLYSHVLMEVITAQMLELNMVVGKFTLSDLIFSGKSWKERLCERIQPRDPICLDMAVNNTLVRTHLENLSATGMSVIIYRTEDKGAYINCDALIGLAFQLPRDTMKMEMLGKQISSRQVGNLVIVGIHLFPSSSQEMRLNQYIMARKAEILDELEWAYQKIFEPRQVQDLYF